MAYVFVDCEGGPAPGIGGGLREFGAAIYPTRETFFGFLRKKDENTDPETEALVFCTFNLWLGDKCKGLGRPIFVSDNPAYDWQFINEAFHRILGKNPFGFSARRIGDFYGGLIGDWNRTQAWKKLRITKHDHNPVHDALGNLEAWERLMNGERPNPISTKAEKRRFY